VRGRERGSCEQYQDSSYYVKVSTRAAEPPDSVQPNADPVDTIQSPVVQVAAVAMGAAAVGGSTLGRFFRDRGPAGPMIGTVEEQAGRAINLQHSERSTGHAPI
jgi:hypothetical protein